LLLLAFIGYFLLIRPTRRRAQEVNAIQRALEVGAEVMLTSGIFGKVTGIGEDERVEVEVAPGVALSVHRAAIGKVIASEPSVDAEDDVAGSAHGEPEAGSDSEPRGAN
jgi:preprotein translocase subunit YajC